MTDLLGPANAVNSVTTEPGDARVFGSADTFFKDCSSSTAQDGTAIGASWLNGILQQIRAFIRGAGITLDNTNDSMLLQAAQALIAGANPATRQVTSSATLNLDCQADCVIGLNRVASVTAMTVNLAGTGILLVGKTFRISDLAKNFDTAIVTVAPPGGHNIAGDANYKMDTKKQSASFCYMGSSTWDVQSA